MPASEAVAPHFALAANNRARGPAPPATSALPVQQRTRAVPSRRSRLDHLPAFARCSRQQSRGLQGAHIYSATQPPVHLLYLPSFATSINSTPRARRMIAHSGPTSHSIDHPRGVLDADKANHEPLARLVRLLASRGPHPCQRHPLGLDRGCPTSAPARALVQLRTSTANPARPADAEGQARVQGSVVLSVFS